MKFLSRLQESLARWMQGRYGTDSLNRALTYAWLILACLNLLLHSYVLYLLELALCFFVLFRTFSRNLLRRRRENARWYEFSEAWKRRFRHVSVRFSQRKTTRFFRCPHCKAPMRMPRKTGRFQIRCTKCNQQFYKEFKR